MRKYLFIGASLSSAGWAMAAPAAAQEVGEGCSGVVYEDGQPVSFVQGFCRAAEDVITVTATGTRSEIEDTGQAVTIVNRSEIEDIQGADLTRVLERAPGVTFSRNGGAGSFTGVRVRGAEAEQLLVVVDGVRVADPASPAGGYDFGNLLSQNVEKMDLLRGSNSTIWGSDAIGGVLAVTTRNLDGVTASAEYGSRETLSASATGGVSGDWGSFGVAGSYYDTEGFSSAASGTEDDGFQQWAIASRGRANASYAVSLFAGGSYSEGDLEIDGTPAPSFVLTDTDEFQKTRQYSAFAGVSYDSGPLFLKGAYSLADTERRNFNPAFGTAPGFTSDGHSDRVELRGEWRAIGPLIVSFGGESEWTSYITNFDALRHDTRISGAYTQLGIEFGGISGHLGVRHDDHARFGGATSFGADLSYEIVPDIRLRASVGEGFKAPTLFQLFSDFGNQALEAEQSTSFDLGIAWNDRNDRFYAGATLFKRDSENQIEFVSCFGSTDPICNDRPFGTYDNVGRVRAQGLEMELGANPSDRFGVRAVYSLTDTENRTLGSVNQGNALARRPRHAVTVSADWLTPIADFTLGGDVRMVSDSFDDAGNFNRLDGYQLVTLRGSLPIGNKVELFGRVENLFDQQYQTALGYGSPGRGAFAGARTRF
ncbi:TonB-dependent receptor plug domain-containing protein [Pontixanthobacter luteolus]|uniref:TonB-dependent receptor plug domain-containing protein n=1 Tax=Pontixanthobacter luteolus TaxID=295089 RepID=UPI0023048456|nr:TonB-dependent receptor [Pontixanthobacter luteolus]